MSATSTRMRNALLVSAALICSACAQHQTKAATLAAPTPERQMAAINWDEINAPTSAVTRNNAFLIMMR